MMPKATNCRFPNLELLPFQTKHWVGLKRVPIWHSFQAVQLKLVFQNAKFERFEPSIETAHPHIPHKTAKLGRFDLSFATGAEHTFLGGQPPAVSSGFFTSIGFVRLRAPVLWPGSAQLYKTLRGKSAGGPRTVFKYPATSLNKGCN